MGKYHFGFNLAKNDVMTFLLVKWPNYIPLHITICINSLVGFMAKKLTQTKSTSNHKHTFGGVDAIELGSM